jgi:acyl carrier protein
MVLKDFVQVFAGQFDDTPVEEFTPSTIFMELEEWGSLVALSIISMIDEEFEKRVTGADLRSVKTIEELYNLIQTK